MSYKYKYEQTFKMFSGGKWVDNTRETWVEFYPLNNNPYFEELDSRSPEEILSFDEIYGKAVIGVCGYSPTYMYLTAKREDIKYE